MGLMRGALGGLNRVSQGKALLVSQANQYLPNRVAINAKGTARVTKYPVETPEYLFANGENGVWYDPSDFTTMWQDAAQTTPVTALGQPIGFIFDKSGNGNHARQTGDAARPTVQARSNLLIRTEEVDNASWTKSNATVSNTTATTDPLGTTNADAIVATLANGSTAVGVGQTLTLVSAQYTLSVYAKANTATKIRLAGLAVPPNDNAYFDLISGTVLAVGSGLTASIVSAGDGWFRCSITGTGTGSPLIRLCSTANVVQYTGQIGDSLYVWGAQLEYGSTANDYQRVTTATDYADIGLPRYLQFDGTDDSLVTAANLDMTATDEVTVCVGIFKQRDTTASCVYETSTAADTNNGAFNLFAPDGPTTNRLGANVRGTSFTKAAAVGAQYDAPNTFIVTSLADISSASNVLRVNQTIAGSNTNSMGTINFGNYPLYIGRRGGIELQFLGRVYQLIIRGAITGGKLLAQTERYVAEKTGITGL